MSQSHPFRFALLSCVLAALPVSLATAADPIRVVFQNGRSLPLDAVSLQGGNLVVKTAADGFSPGQSFALATADHIFGDKPAELNSAVALLLTDKPKDALRLLEPIVEAQRASAEIPGNYWLEAARAALVAYSIDGNTAKATEIGKDISDATPAQGNDPFVALGKALLMPLSTKLAEREVALRDQTTDNLPADVCAYASFFRAKILKTAKREDEALEAFLTVPGMFPAGGVIINAAAELNGAEILAGRDRREEAIALFTSAARQAAGTSLAAEANKRLESLK